MQRKNIRTVAREDQNQEKNKGKVKHCYLRIERL
jgi:hypothetical protein